MIRMFQPDVAFCAVAVAAQIRSSFIGPGKATAEFEALLAETVGRKHAIATTSGTTALMLSLMALDLLKSSPIGFPAYGMLAGANTARLLGYHVKLIDVSPENGCLNPAPDDCDFIGIAHNGMPLGFNTLFEDACQALGIPGVRGAVCCLSFSPQKIVTTGQGGAILTNDDALALRIRQLIDHGGDWRETRTFKRIGGNFRFNDVLASLGIPQLKRLPELVARRMEVRSWYRERFPQIDSNDGWLVMFPSRDAAGLVRHLAAYQIEASQLYPPVSWSEPFKTERSFPGAEAFHKRMCYLPSHNSLTRMDVMTVCDRIEEFESCS